ncbi:MAG: hypothetical protein GY864_08370, partial [Desulfobacterales bacterium]|nr:hypothetical protein [Desulfobacterales bacterium]
MVKEISSWVVKYKWVTLGVILIITAFFTYEIKNMVIRTEITDLYPPNHPFIKVHNEYKDTLGSPFKVLMMLKVKKGDIYNKETLAKVIRINDALDAIPGVNHNYVYSIASRKIKKIKYTEFGVEAQYLMQEVPPSMELFKEEIRTAPGVYGVWVSK